MMDSNTLLPKKRPESVPPQFGQKESVAQVISLLRTNTQNIFHLENNDPSHSPPFDSHPSSTTTYPLNSSHPFDSYSSTSTYPITSSLAPPPSAPNRKLSTLKGGHKYSKSATTAADFKNAFPSMAKSHFEWDSKISESRNESNRNGNGGRNTIMGGIGGVVREVVGGVGGGGSGDVDLLGVGDYLKGRPRSYSESTSAPLSFLDSDPNSPSQSPTLSKKKGKKEKRTSKPLAPVMPFTSNNKRSSVIHDGSDGIISINVEDTSQQTAAIDNEALCSETLVALHAAKEKEKDKEKDKRGLKKKSPSQNDLLTPTSAPPSSAAGYFDKFMQDFYPNLPSPTTPRSVDSKKDYHKLFGLPHTEPIIAKFKCAHRGKLLKQGKLIITQSSVCFYSSLFLAKKIIRFGDIVNFRKVSNAFLLSNAIKIVTLQKKYYFGLFEDRDAAFEALVAQWVKCGAQISAAIEEDLTSKDLPEVPSYEDEVPTMQRVKSPPVVGRRSRKLQPSPPSIRDIFTPPTPPDASSLRVSDSALSTSTSVSPHTLPMGIRSSAPPTSSPTNKSPLSTSTGDGASPNIYTAYKFKSAYPQSSRAKRSAHVFNEDTVMPINKWLTEMANEDARYRVLKGVVFGTSLENLPLSEKGDTYLSSVPTFVADALSYLQAAGYHVKRLFAQFVDPTEVGALRVSVEAGRADFFRNATNPKLLAALLKQFLAELPVPVLSNFDIVLCTDIDEPVYHKSCLRSFVYSLPFHHRTTLNALITFFRILVNNRNINETSQHDLANIFGPILLNKPFADLMFIAESARVVDQLITYYDEIFSDKDKSAVYVMKRGFQVIKHATLDQLVVKLVDPYYGDADFVDIIITTHNLYYIKTEDLVDRLIFMYDRKPGEQIWKHKLRLRILYLLTLLVHHLENPTGKETVSGPPQVIDWFYTRHYNSSTSKDELHLLDLLIKPAQTVPAATDPSLKTKKIKAKYQPLDLATQDLACQMALIDLKYFKELPLDELMSKNFAKPEKSPHFQAMVQLFNRWSLWVGTEIFACPDIHARVAVIEKIISLAEFLRELRDFHGAYAITAGLNHYSITRLHMTLERVNKKSKQTLAALQELFNSEANHKNYRDILQRSTPPLVPYLGLYSKDLFVIEENLGPNVLPNGMVNFEKMRSVYIALKAVKHLQSFSYGFPEVPALAKLMLEKPLLTEDEMDEKSREFEPRKPRPPPPAVAT